MARPGMWPGMPRPGRPAWCVLVGLILAGLASAILLIPRAVEGQGPGPPVPHPIEGREACSQCHGQSGALGLPSGHVGRPDEACLACHTAASPSPEPAATPAPEPIPANRTPGPTPTPTPTPLAEPLPAPQPTVVPSPLPNDMCLGCHGAPGLTKAFPNGDTVSLTISADAFRESVHGDLLICQDCHRGYEQLPHPALNAGSHRDFSIAHYEVCKQCHFANYTKTLDSVHFQELIAGNRQAPLCTDCHGAHDVTSPSHPRSRVAQTCAQCHREIYAIYRESVHGQALVSEENQDVPTCTYCHGVHSIRDPRTSRFHLEIPQLCGSCHSDKERMAKYGLSTNVTSTYLRDFHGVTVSLARKENPDILSYEAVCTDCHGVHDIVSTKSASSPVMKENLVKTCRQCHPGASANFPSAWLSHWEPSLTHAPLVFLVKMFYRIFIPMVVVGLSIQVLLNLWRSAINR